MDHSMPDLPVHHQLPELAQTHVHWVSDAIQLSHLLPSPSPPTLNLSQHQGLFKWVSSLHQVARVLEWIAISFSRGSSQPRNRTQVSCIAGRFFTDWAMREALKLYHLKKPKIYWSKFHLNFLKPALPTLKTEKSKTEFKWEYTAWCLLLPLCECECQWLRRVQLSVTPWTAAH